MGYLKAVGEVFLRYRYLLANLVGRDIKVKYRRSVLGVAWSVLNPLLMMIIMSAVFSYLFRFEIQYFPVYLLCGQVTFSFFNEATTSAMDSLLMNAPLIKKVYIPKYIFPIEKVLFSAVNTLFSLIPLVAVVIFFHFWKGLPITPWILLTPIPFLILALFNIGVGMLLSALVVFFRDIKHFYSVITLALTYLTPIFYPESMLPQWMKIIVRCNPVYWFVAMVRQLVLYGAAPTGWEWIMTCGWAIVALIIGFAAFKRLQDRFILYI